MNPMRSAMAALSAANKTAMGESVLYRRRSGESATLILAAGSTGREQSSDRGFTSVVGTDDVIVNTADFRTAFGDTAVPEEGDQIERNNRLFAVRPVGGEPCWRYRPFEVEMRIHLEDEGDAP